MSIPTHNLYDFVHRVTEKKFIVRYFYPWGSKDLTDVVDLFSSNTKYEICKLKQEYKHTCYLELNLHRCISENIDFAPFQPILFCHDQEPLQFDLYRDSLINQELFDKKRFDKWKESGKLLIKNLNLRFVYPESYQKYWILLHSELNSHELTFYEDTKMFIGAYWWSHAMIARDWYRYAEYDKRLSDKDAKNLFLVYCRDTSGNRQYRNNFFNLLNNYQLNQHCWFGNGGNSDSSATYDVDDIVSTNFHIVLETVFDQRIHLTEKTLRPIACGQPFIIANGPGTLKYLKTYGFKTFSPWIDESYDQEHNNQSRLTLIIKEMKRLSELPQSDLKVVVDRCNKIAEYNKKVFFSEEFFSQVVVELKTNVSQAYHYNKNTLDWKIMWKSHNRKKLTDRNIKWEKRRPYMLHLIRHLKKGGTIENYVPPDLD